MSATTSVGKVEVRPAVPATGPKRSGRRRRRSGGDNWAALAMVGPNMVLFLLFMVIPALASIVLSFYDWDLFSTPQWAGLANFGHLFRDADAWASLRVTCEFLVMGVVPTILVGFMLAVFINTKMRGIGAIRVLYLAPMVASTAIAGVLWAYLYDPRYGLVNYLLSWAGIHGPSWLSDPRLAAPALVVMLVWLALPLVTILYLAGLQRISPDIYAAAAMDGAGPWRQLWSVTWPNVVPTTALVAILQIINFMSGSFEVSLIMTGGGPLGATQTLALYAYRVAFGQTDMGYASVLNLLQLVLIGLVVAVIRGVIALRRRYW